MKNGADEFIYPHWLQIKYIDPCHNRCYSSPTCPDRSNYKKEYKLCLLVHMTLIGHAPDYNSDLLTPVADMPSRSSLRASSKSSSFIYQEHIQHNVQEERIAYGRCDKAEVQH